LDFRDPFANNPRFVYTPKHKELVSALESKYIKDSDHALSVNRYCLDALHLDDPNKGVVVANGFDERVSTSIEAIPLREGEQRHSFVYTGSFYSDRNAEPFLKAMDKDKQTLIHIGRQQQADSHLDSYEATGELHNITKNLKGVYWTRNTETSLSKFFETYIPSQVGQSDENRTLYSRRAQTERLLDVILNK